MPPGSHPNPIPHPRHSLLPPRLPQLQHLPAGTVSPTTTTSAPIPTPAAVPAPNADAGTNMNASLPTASPGMEDVARKAFAINFLKKDYRPERLEFQFVKSRPMGLIVEDSDELTMVVDFKLKEDGA